MLPPTPNKKKIHAEFSLQETCTLHEASGLCGRGGGGATRDRMIWVEGEMEISKKKGNRGGTEVGDETEFGTYRMLPVSFARTPLPNNRVRESGGFYAARDGGNKVGNAEKRTQDRSGGRGKLGEEENGSGGNAPQNLSPSSSPTG